MKYLSIDIETTGIDSKNDQIIEIGAILEDTNNILPYNEIPKFHAIVRHDRYSGSAYAINMNQRIFEILAKREAISDLRELNKYDYVNHIVRYHYVALRLNIWLTENLDIDPISREPIKIIGAGKNFAGFDKQFLMNIPEFNNYIKFDHRSLDPAMFYVDFINDHKVPSTDSCLNRAEINSEVTHEALADAWNVIQLLRKQYKPVSVEN